MSEITPTFHGEVQLAGWSETHNGGAKIVLWLSDPSDLDAFRALTMRKGNQAGQRFMAALVEIDDNEQPVQQPAGPAPESEPERPKGGALARLAGMWCNDEEFWTWLRLQRVRCENADDAAMYIRRTCSIESRAELDSNADAERVFQERIRTPFMYWRRKEGR
ncbi:hypothetical protein G167_gp69 [Burkholderia phage BcepMigl]|uniref:Uncharacterized protein n=1 Tax=Burkholderia phage BcepMigl TaxID=2886899 RepID=I6WB02_9CAUD|nr:hypothetical protein G167_gp69 [Burkholderia phage BcepMigl]AFN39085.1 hypothetical protein BcepMigl_gp16 [Burkholderia phage BcepMigl]